MHVRTQLPFALLLTLSTVAAAGPEKAAPRYRFKQGDKLAYVVEASTKIETSANGRTNTAEMTQVIDLTWEVGAVDAEGKAAITQTIDRIRFKAVTPRETAEYDTRSGAEPEAPHVKKIAARLDAVVGGRIRASIDARGGLADIRLIGRAGAGRTVPAADWGDLGSPASEAGFRRLIGQLIPVLPEAAPPVGESWWARTTEALSDGKATTERRYTYEGSEEHGGRPADKLSLTIARQTEDGAGEKRGGTTGTGTVFFDAAAGRLIESALTHTRELDVSADDGKLTRKVTETITLKLADPAK
jgi:hypothetical protein